MLSQFVDKISTVRYFDNLRYVIENWSEFYLHPMSFTNAKNNSDILYIVTRSHNHMEANSQFLGALVHYCCNICSDVTFTNNLYCNKCKNDMVANRDIVNFFRNCKMFVHCDLGKYHKINIKLPEKIIMHQNFSQYIFENGMIPYDFSITSEPYKIAIRFHRCVLTTRASSDIIKMMEGTNIIHLPFNIDDIILWRNYLYYGRLENVNWESTYIFAIQLDHKPFIEYCYNQLISMCNIRALLNLKLI